MKTRLLCSYTKTRQLTAVTSMFVDIDQGIIPAKKYTDTFQAVKKGMGETSLGRTP